MVKALSSLAEALSGQSPSGGQPALAEAFGKAKPAVSDIKQRLIPLKAKSV